MIPNEESESEQKGYSKWSVRGLRGGFPQESMKIWFSKTQKSIFSVIDSEEKHEDSDPHLESDDTDLSRKMDYWNAATVDQQLLWILESESGLRYFETFMKSIYSEESLYFWFEVGKYEKLTDAIEMESEYLRIVDTYLRDGCRYQVNLPHHAFDAAMVGIHDPTVRVCVSAFVCVCVKVCV